MRPHPEDRTDPIDDIMESICLIGIASFVVSLLLYLYDPKLLACFQ